MTRLISPTILVSIFLTLSITIIPLTYGNDDNCVKQYFDQNSFVCVCNISDCRSIEPATPVPKGFIFTWESSQDQHRFHRTERSTKDLPRNEVIMETSGSSLIRVRLLPHDQRQTIVGFGGAFTDATGYNLLDLPANLSDHIMQDYFSRTGLDYSLARVPIGGTDFSNRLYTYNDNQDGDFELKNFALQPEDTQLKIPMIERALELKEGRLKLLGSAWSPPAWMKTNNDIKGNGFLKGAPGGPYYKAWAKYHVKFLEAYSRAGINFWGITTGNEPTNAIINEDFFFNCLGMTPELLRDYVKLDLGPTLRDAGYGTDKLQVLLHDEVRQFMPNYTETVLFDEEAASFVTGIGFHWYRHGAKDFFENLERAHENFANKFLLGTEACEGWQRFSSRRAQLGNWTRAETYAVDIIKGLQRYSSGWLDWNLALNTKGGPSWAENWTDGLILVDAESATYYRNPMFYSLGHFSKFIPPGSIYIGHEIHGNDTGVLLASFIDPADQVVMVVLNTNDEPVDLVVDGFAEASVPIKMDAHSIKTLVTPKVLA